MIHESTGTQYDNDTGGCEGTLVANISEGKGTNKTETPSVLYCDNKNNNRYTEVYIVQIGLCPDVRCFIVQQTKPRR